MSKSSVASVTEVTNRDQIYTARWAKSARELLENYVSQQSIAQRGNNSYQSLQSCSKPLRISALGDRTAVLIGARQEGIA